MSKSQAARTFSVSLSSVKRYVDRAQRGESLAPKESPGSAPKLDEKARKLLEDDLQERPFASLRERCEYIEVMDGALGEPLNHVPRHSPHRSYQDKGGRVATEHDEFKRVLWRVTVAQKIAPPRGLCSWTSAGRTPPWRRSTATPPGASACICPCPEIGPRTLRYSRA